MPAVDALVVGAGPAGSTAAYHLARRGFEVVVAEEHPRVGYPVQCAGLISPRAFDLAGRPPIVRQAIRGATVLGPSLEPLEFRAPEPRALVIDRGALDVHLAERAADAGATFRPAFRFDGRGPDRDGHPVARFTDGHGQREEVEARVIVGADGVASAVARAFRCRRPLEILPAFEAEFADAPIDPECVEVYLGRSIAPGLFGWSIPDGMGGARIGVAVEASTVPAREHFRRLVAAIERRHHRPPRTPTSYLVSGIPIGRIPRTSGDSYVVVGDAAGQVKPLSGGGIFTGMRCAELAAEVVADALRDGDVSAGRLARYDQAWTAELGDEFHRALALRRIFRRLSDADLDDVVRAMRSAHLEGTIVAFGDIDFPTGVARAVLRQSPSLVRLAPKALGAWLGGSGPRAPDLDFDARRIET